MHETFPTCPACCLIYSTTPPKKSSWWTKRPRKSKCNGYAILFFIRCLLETSFLCELQKTTAQKVQVQTCKYTPVKNLKTKWEHNWCYWSYYGFLLKVPSTPDKDCLQKKQRETVICKSEKSKNVDNYCVKHKRQQLSENSILPKKCPEFNFPDAFQLGSEALLGSLTPRGSQTVKERNVTTEKQSLLSLKIRLNPSQIL